MIQTMDEMEIRLSGIPNAHLLILGKSGMGKTYFQCQQIKEGMKMALKTLIVDFSGSFTRKELEKFGFKGMEQAEYIDVANSTIHIPFLEGEKKWDIERIAKALAEVFNVKGYLQKSLIKQLVEYLWDSERIQMVDMFNYLEMMHSEAMDMDSEKARRIEEIMDKFQCLKDCCSLVLERYTPKSVSDKIVTILQLSEIPIEPRMKFAELILEIVWDLVQREGVYQRIVLDEIQHLDCGRSKALSAMMREGRKYDLGLMISTQFIDTKDKAKTETLLQAANILFFKPTLGATRPTARLIDTEHVEEWREILEHLKVGECVLKGTYYIGKKNKECQKSIVCKIIKSYIDLKT